MDQWRRLEAETYAKSKTKQEKGFEGNKLAMSFLRECNASDAAHDAALRCCHWHPRPFRVDESDLTKTLAALMTETKMQPPSMTA